MNILELHKLNRALWIALIEDEKFIEANSSFNTYMTNLQKLKLPKNLREELDYEYKYAQEIYYKKMLDKAEFLYNSKKYSNAIICYQILSNVCKQLYFDKFPVRYYIKSLLQLNQYDLAKILMSKLLEFDNSHDILPFIADCYAQMKEYENSVKYYTKYIESKNELEINANEWFLYGCYYEWWAKNDNYNETNLYKAVDCMKKAHALNPRNKCYIQGIAIASPNSEKKLKYECYQKMFNLSALTPAETFNFATLCLNMQDFDNWHKYNISRIYLDQNKKNFPEELKPLWLGEEDISNSTLLVYCEDGYGDNIMMWGYMPRLVQMAKKVIYITYDELCTLFSNNSWGVEILPISSTKVAGIEHDYFIPPMSIPNALKVNRTNIGFDEGYIKADRDLTELYKCKYFNTNKLKIGISFSGSDGNDHNRNIPTEFIAKLNISDNIQYYILNKNIDNSVCDTIKQNNIINLGKTFRDFNDTAAAIENLDLVISTDNVILNLAGALGKKTFGLFNKYAEYRWFDLSGENIVWYTSVKPFQNTEMNNWGPTIDKVIEEIKRML